MNGLSTTAAADLKIAFDRGFAILPHEESEKSVDLLGVSIHGNAYALRLEAVAGLHANKRITRIPVLKPGLLGIAGFRGAILPVYDLGILIGLRAVERPHWLAIIAKTDVAIAFETFEGHLRVPTTELAPNESKDGGRQHLTHLLRSDGVLRGVINLASALRPVMGADQA
jgi:chemotaxis signal transduction protein